MTRTDQRREIRGYGEVRAAAKDVASFSSDLLGDRDTRTYKQVPVEYDPPAHTRYRELLTPLFLRSAVAAKEGQFEQAARELVAAVSARGGGDVVHDLALPYVMRCLTVLYNRPQDLTEWVSWGPDVWTAEAYRAGDRTAGAPRGGTVLEDYLDRVFAAAVPRPGADPATTDVWDWLAGLDVDGRPLTREERLGIGNILLAGGRDTVITLVTGLVWHLVGNPEDRDLLRTTPEARGRAVSELVRYLSPLPAMERVLAEDRGTPLAQRDPRRYVVLNFRAANRDTSVWPDADVLDIRRERHPHLGFGVGRHSCMGMAITESETRALLTVLLDDWPGWRTAGEPVIEWVRDGAGDDGFTALHRFVSVPVTTG